MRLKTGSFNRIKNREQGGKKQKMKKEQGSKYRAQSCLSVWGLANWTNCISGQAEHSEGHDT